MYGLPEKAISKLQRIQNTAARLISRVPRSHHISSTLRDLHWLPIKWRITYKILLLTYKAIHGLSPLYLSELIHPYIPARTLRSSNLSLLTIPDNINSIHFGHRSFYHASATLWNSVPLHIRQAESISIFKSHLKTHLFSIAYN